MTRRSWTRAARLLVPGLAPLAMWLVLPPELAAAACLVAVAAALRAFVLVSSGDLEIELTPTRVLPGERFEVRLFIGENASPVERIEVLFLCVDSRADPRRGWLLARDRVLMEQRVRLCEPGELPTPGGAVELGFCVPHDAPATRHEVACSTTWHLLVRVWSGFGSCTEWFDAPMIAAR
jgi:hypothetical protein